MSRLINKHRHRLKVGVPGLFFFGFLIFLALGFLLLLLLILLITWRLTGSSSPLMVLVEIRFLKDFSLKGLDMTPVVGLGDQVDQGDASQFLERPQTVQN